jgi:serine/threonine protein kinase
MGLATGSVLGPYELLAQIGAGGMGQVYRARDTRLGRIVAIKVLPPHRFAVGDFSDRFRREARAISSLSHPNICALFDVGETEMELGGQRVTVSYLVMEYLEGETLRARMKRGLAARQSLDIAVQIANGLAAAHRKGLVHRDLKPENVFVNPDGVVKILDFGLVKAVDDAESTGVDRHEANTLRHTEPGTVVGTAHYMSPEQIRGETIDHRSDIFSFGVVLYEMLAGAAPFDGTSPFETMAQVLTVEPPDLAALIPELPPGVSEIVERCLAKPVEDRFVSARDLAFSLEAISRGSRPPSSLPRLTPRPGSSSGVRPAERGTRKSIAGAAILMAAIGLTIAGGRFLGRHGDDPGPPSTRPLTHSGRDGSPAASPDGRLVAFVSSRDGSKRIWLKQIADGTEVALTSGPDDSAPRFSPDGATVLFTRAGTTGSALYRIAVVGGDARKTIENAFAGDIAPDGNRVAFIRNRISGRRFSTLCIGTPGSSAVKEIAATPDDDLGSPRWSPDGEWIAVTRKPRSTTAASIVLVSPDGAKQRVVSRPEVHSLLSAVAWTGDSRSLVFTELELITAVSQRTRGGTARVLLYDLSSETFKTLLWNPHASTDAVDLLPDGRLLFSEDFTRQNLQEIRLAGAGETRGPNGDETHWLTRGTAIDRQPSYSADGRRIVFTSDRSGNADVWEITLETGAVRRLTDDPAVDWDPMLLADGSLLWSSSRSGHFEAWHAAVDGGGARQVTTDGFDAENPSAPRDAGWIYYDSSHPEKEGLWRVRPDGSNAAKVIGGETAHPEVSADGEYVLYHRPEEGGGTATVEVLRVSDGVVFPLVRGLQGFDPGRARWLGNTRTVVYSADDGRGRAGIFEQEFVPGRDTLASRRPLAGFDRETTLDTYAISPDGTRAVLSILEPASSLMITDKIEGLGTK